MLSTVTLDVTPALNDVSLECHVTSDVADDALVTNVTLVVYC